MQQIGVLSSVQVGTPHRYGVAGATDAQERPWRTSFFRAPSTQPRWLYTTHLEGNEQADKKNHGRLHQAVLLYAASHYPAWKRELSLPEIGPGGFGENFTMDGLSEQTACIGDTYALGEALIQVTGPRYPCWKIERRWGRPGLTDRVAASGRTGWYCRVLREGMVEPGLPILLADRPYPQWTIALTNDFGHRRNRDVETARELASCPLLNEWWQGFILQRVQNEDD
ncbi:MAG TPA: MOSC domain-containing protein [Ktedonobacteraceae bacterium]|nr:MOSC domain-containing protein [Ktedonobacteraceae bacterium]